ncbi:gamma-glutamylcyclotransferase [Rhizobium sp. Rhizsp82]|uniref:gamma-glutamylcyclotransferase n=1 Tax=Rhizobium sp. Rhizsp82 TaxID=3243057 RepID=UPI0039B473CB
MTPMQSAPNEHAITRDALLNGSFLLRARSIPGVSALTDEQLERSLDEAMASRPHGDEVWLFAYGSLIWNPAFDYEDRVGASVTGWQRSFCLSAPFGRGTPEHPTLFLALDKGGEVNGVAYKLPKGRERDELLLVWRREMFASGYQAKWVKIQKSSGECWAITFVANTISSTYEGQLSPEAVSERLRKAEGPLGSGIEYLYDTIRHLEELGLDDMSLNKIKRLIDRHTAAIDHS